MEMHAYYCPLRLEKEAYNINVNCNFILVIMFILLATSFLKQITTTTTAAATTDFQQPGKTLILQDLNSY